MSSAETGTSSVQIVHYLAIVCARESILIANPYFVPDAVALQTLVEAKQRGVDVQIMVSGIRNDNWLARQNSVRLYGDLLRAGIRILEFNRSMLHQKVMVAKISATERSVISRQSAPCSFWRKAPVKLPITTSPAIAINPRKNTV
jgi:hypothetical protein